jgi:hypothetical protein
LFFRGLNTIQNLLAQGLYFGGEMTERKNLSSCWIPIVRFCDLEDASERDEVEHFIRESDGKPADTVLDWESFAVCRACQKGTENHIIRLSETNPTASASRHCELYHAALMHRLKGFSHALVDPLAVAFGRASRNLAKNAAEIDALVFIAEEALALRSFDTDSGKQLVDTLSAGKMALPGRVTLTERIVAMNAAVLREVRRGICELTFSRNSCIARHSR